MSIDIKDRVDVVVSLGTQPISTASFDSAMFLVEVSDIPVAFTEDYRVYTNLAGMITDGFAITDSAYLFAALVFGGNFPAKSLYVVQYETGTTTPTAAFNTMVAADSTAYWIGCDDHTAAIVSPLVLAAASVNKMVVNTSEEAGILVPATDTDSGSVLQALGYDNVITLYHSDADANYASGGIIGAMAAIQAGTSTLEDKTLVGVSSDSFTATEITALQDKNVAYYSTIAGVNSLFNSKVASGQFLDTIVFADWLKARIGEQVYGLLKRTSDQGKKVSYDEKGMTLIRSSIRQVIDQGLANGSISPDIYPLIRTPTREEISDANRADRILPDVVVEILYSGAIHKVMIRAYVSI